MQVGVVTPASVIILDSFDATNYISTQPAEIQRDMALHRLRYLKTSTAEKVPFAQVYQTPNSLCKLSAALLAKVCRSSHRWVICSSL